MLRSWIGESDSSCRPLSCRSRWWLDPPELHIVGNIEVWRNPAKRSTSNEGGLPVVGELLSSVWLPEQERSAGQDFDWRNLTGTNNPKRYRSNILLLASWAVKTGGGDWFSFGRRFVQGRPGCGKAFQCWRVGDAAGGTALF